VIALELACAAIVLLYLGLAARRSQSYRSVLTRYSVIAATAWCAEDSCIRLYGFYHYSKEWSVFLDQTPIMITLIWPVVILTAYDFVLALRFDSQRAAIWTGIVVVSDAALIEPISVMASLWRWTEPGAFGVPPIGVLGWGLFAFLVVRLGLLSAASDQQHRIKWSERLVRAGVVLTLTHTGLLLLWWVIFRWCNHVIPDVAAVAGAWTLSISGVALAIRHRIRCDSLAPLLDRAPGAVFFFVLLGLLTDPTLALVAFSCAFPVSWAYFAINVEKKIHLNQKHKP
jgi:hypothetical protein